MITFLILCLPALFYSLCHLCKRGHWVCHVANHINESACRSETLKRSKLASGLFLKLTPVRLSHKLGAPFLDLSAYCLLSMSFPSIFPCSDQCALRRPGRRAALALGSAARRRPGPRRPVHVLASWESLCAAAQLHGSTYANTDLKKTVKSDECA